MIMHGGHSCRVTVSAHVSLPASTARHAMASVASWRGEALAPPDHPGAQRDTSCQGVFASSRPARPALVPQNAQSPAGGRPLGSRHDTGLLPRLWVPPRSAASALGYTKNTPGWRAASCFPSASQHRRAYDVCVYNSMIYRRIRIFKNL